MSNDRELVTFEVDKDTKELAKQKLQFGEMSSLLRDELRRVAFGEEVSKRERLRSRVEDLRDQRDSLRADKREIEAEIEEVETELARAEERMDGLERKEDRYDAQLEMLEELLADGMRLDPENPKVITAAKTGGVEAEDVIQELQERHPNVPEQAFKQKLDDPREYHGFQLRKESEE